MIDFGAEWRSFQRSRSLADDADAWSARSAHYDNASRKSGYADEFIRLAEVRPGSLVLDMGCGTGAIALPLARAGNAVIAADFSDGMLERLKEKSGELEEERRPRLMKLAWEDDWEALGLGENSVDLACASRSLGTYDLEAALRKLDGVARERCCITVATEVSPKLDGRLLSEIGVRPQRLHAHVFAIGILAAAGREPELRCIRTQRHDSFATREEAFAKYAKMIGDSGATFQDGEREAAERRLDLWLDEHLIENERAGEPDCKGLPEQAFCLDAPRELVWAFISWSTTGRPWRLPA